MSVELPPDLSVLISPEAFRLHDEAVESMEEQKRRFESIDPNKASVDELRFLVKHLIKTQADSAKQAAQPLGVDPFSNLPVHFDPPECPLCKPFGERLDETTGKYRPVCHDCNERIPYVQEFSGRGIESASVTHLHMHTVRGGKGEQIRVPARRELCLTCFRIDYTKTTGRECDL